MVLGLMLPSGSLGFSLPSSLKASLCFCSRTLLFCRSAFLPTLCGPLSGDNIARTMPRAVCLITLGAELAAAASMAC